MHPRYVAVAVVAGLALPVGAPAGVNRWTTQGPYAGRIQALALDPANPDVVYAGTAAGGVLRSHDGGAQWEPSARGWSFFSDFYIAMSLAIDPQRPSTVYAGSDWGGVYQSTDGGRTWRPRRDGLHDYGSVVPGLAIDPSDPSVMYAATLHGVYQSLDAGCTWAEANTGLPIVNGEYLYTSGIVIDPSDYQTLYLGTSSSGLWKSIDGGATWFAASQGLLYPITSQPAIDPVDPSHLLLPNNLYYTDVGGGVGTVLESDDAGASWHPASASLSSAYFTAVVFDPGSPGTVWASSYGQGVFRSDDFGDTWAPASQGLADLGVGTLVAAPGGILLAGSSSGGPARSNDGGGSWNPASVGFSASRSILLSAGVSDPDLIFVSGLTPSAGIWRTIDGGQTWIGGGSGLTPAAEGRGIAVDPSNGSVAYFCQFVAGSQAPLVFKTVDGGASWVSIAANFPIDSALSLAVDPSDSQVVFAGGVRNFHRSGDGGTTWTPATTQIQVTSRILARGGGLPLIALAGGFPVGQPYISADGGDTWAPATAGLTAGIMSLAGDPSNGSRLFAGSVGQGAFVSTDGGASWSPTGGALPTAALTALAVDPTDPSHLVAGTTSYFIGPYPSQGVLESHDSGATWAPLDHGLDNLPALEISDLLFSPDGQTLHVAALDGVHEYSYAPTPPPVPTAATPFSGPTAGGTAFAIGGSGFQSGATVLVGAAAASGVLVMNASTITATTPPGTSGAADLVVLNADGQFETLRRAFVYDYEDVPPSSSFHAAVASLARAGVTVGCGPGLFCPNDALTRGQMAVFLERAIHGADVQLPSPPGGFTDVLACSPEGVYILQLAFEGVTVGCGTGIYCPDAPSTRAQGAVFILKAEHGATYTPPPATGDVFEDVPADAFAAGFIEQLAAEGITVGCGDGRFCPDDPLTRAQVAAYIIGSLQ